MSLIQKTKGSKDDRGATDKEAVGLEKRPPLDAISRRLSPCGMEGEKQKVSDEEEGRRYREMVVQKGTSKGTGWGWLELEGGGQESHRLAGKCLSTI